MFLLADDLILLNTPRCASHTTESAIVHSNIEYKYASTAGTKIISYYSTNVEDFYRNISHIPHGHFRLNDCYKVFGRKNSISITRDYFDKFLSSLAFFYELMNYNSLQIDTSIVTSDFIKQNFDLEFTHTIENNPNELHNTLLKVLGIDDSNINIKLSKSLLIFNSIKWWHCNEKVQYEFDIHELDKFKAFIEDRYDTEIIIEHENKSKKDTIFPNLVVDDDLKAHIWETFEKKYYKKAIF